MQQQQQYADFDLLAVFSEESKADAAESKLRKEGFGDEEVFRMAPGSVGKGEFREHGPDRDRSAVFLQTSHARPRPLTIILWAILTGLVLGVLAFGVFDFGIKSIAVIPATLLGVLLGVIIGIVIGMTRKGRVRGAIGQDLSKAKPAATPTQRPTAGAGAGALTVVAVRLPDPENISRKSKARAILLNNGGKIDRSVGRS
jgi:hypothetical protein